MSYSELQIVSSEGGEIVFRAECGVDEDYQEAFVTLSREQAVEFANSILRLCNVDA